MDRLISEKEVLKAFEKYLRFEGNFHEMIKAISSAELKWIPASERLPKPNQKDGLVARYYLIQNEYGDMLVARYDGKGWEQIYQYDYLEDEVIAWMPLPKPYKGEHDG